ncbi:unnamed protein product [Vicia faba]|uniref:Uncharacterized protein n=1 Tax=Vicia faba TaxID=3906 RepID=A0AAV1AY78_VICFA|nr:unnamed protein product [Vicia faba]
MCAEETKCDVEIYKETRLSSGEKTYMERLKEKGKGHVNVEENEDGEDNESSEDSLNGIHFEDSEEERMHNFYEDIGEGASIGRVDNGDGTSQMDNGQGIHKGLTTTEIQKEHVIEDDYITYKLDNGANDDSDNAGSKKRGGPKGTTKKGSTSKKSKATAENGCEVTAGNESQATAGNGSQATVGNKAQAPTTKNMSHATQPEENYAPTDVTPTQHGVHLSQNSVTLSEAMKIYYGIDPDELEALLNDDDILDIPPLRIDTSPAKNNMPGPKIFIGKCPKASKPVVNPTMSDHVKIMISPKKKSKIVASPIRKSDRLRTLMTKNIEGYGRDPNDPFVIPEEDSTIGSSRRKKKWDDIQKSVTQ